MCERRWSRRFNPKYGSMASITNYVALFLLPSFMPHPTFQLLVYPLPPHLHGSLTINRCKEAKCTLAMIKSGCQERFPLQEYGNPTPGTTHLNETPECLYPPPPPLSLALVSQLAMNPPGGQYDQPLTEKSPFSRMTILCETLAQIQVSAQKLEDQLWEQAKTAEQTIIPPPGLFEKPRTCAANH